MEYQLESNLILSSDKAIKTDELALFSLDLHEKIANLAEEYGFTVAGSLSFIHLEEPDEQPEGHEGPSQADEKG